MMASELVGESGWMEYKDVPRKGGPGPFRPGDWKDLVGNLEREVIAGDIVHYSATLRTGHGLYDRIGIHRVVRESDPYRPIRTQDAILLLHGDLKDFEGMFLPGQFSPNLPDDFGIAVYLAQNDVDVWGIDQGWNLVPAEETNFSFFADWGIQKEVDHLGLALAVARKARAMTGNGKDRMLLLGYSSGSATGYTLLDQEAQRAPGLRQVKGYVAADFGVRSDDPDWLAVNGDLAVYQQSLYDGGQYEDALIFHDVALLAKNDPTGDSPYIPGFTNMQVALYFGGGMVYYPVMGHYHAPVLEDDMVVGFQYITTEQWLDFMENMAAYEPLRFELDVTRICAGIEPPYLDHLGEVTVPVLDIGGAGGYAPSTSYTVSQLGSSDITQLYVQLHPDNEVELDYGHVDIFTAWNAPDLVWHPILDWVNAHSGRGHMEGDGIAALE
jgi:hypothetical protein